MYSKSRITIASYPGGKSDQGKHKLLFDCVPHKIPYLIEPFAGLANFFLVTHPRVKRVWLNDKNQETYALLMCLREENLLSSLIDAISSINPVERDDYYQWKGFEPNKILDQAVRKLVILNCSPNGAGGGYSKEKAHRKWYVNKPKIWKEIHAIFKEKNAKITNWDYLNVLESIKDKISNNFTDKFLYLDPPYFNVAKKGNLYGKDYNDLDWDIFKQELQQLSIPFIMSNRDTPEMRALFSNYHLLGYNTYNDMNNTRNKNPELLVSNLTLEGKKGLR